MYMYYFCVFGMQFLKVVKGPGGSMSQVVGLPNNSYKPITNTAWVRAWICKLQKGCTRLAAASDKVYQLLAHGWWLSPGTPASSTTKTCRNDIAEILLKVALNTKKSNQKQLEYFRNKGKYYLEAHQNLFRCLVICALFGFK